MLRSTRRNVKRARVSSKKDDAAGVAALATSSSTAGWTEVPPAASGGPNVQDFYCEAARLCIEADGEARSGGDIVVRDADRVSSLADAGIRNIRIAAADVLKNLGGVLQLIVV
jgi:Protein of unknown function (DUF559)